MNYFVEGIQGAGKSTLVGKLAEKFPKYQVFREGDYNPVELAWCTYMTKKQYEETLRRYAQIADEIKAHTTIETADEGMQNANEARLSGDRKPTGNVDPEERYIVTYTRIITDIPGFHKDLEQYEIYNNRVERETFEEIILSRFAKWYGEDQILECSIFQNIIENQILFFEMTDDEIVEFYRRLAGVLGKRNYQILYLEAEDPAKSLEVIRRERVDADGNEMWFPLMLSFLEESPHGKKLGLKGFDGLVEHMTHRRDLELRILREVFPENSLRVARNRPFEAF